MPITWWLARSEAQREHIACKSLRAAGAIPYCPRFYDRVLKRRSPLFATYLFVRPGQLPPSSVRTTHGAHSPLSFGDHIATVPPDVISELRSRENRHGNIVLNQPQSFQPGDPVRFKSGPFAGLLAVFQEMTNHERVVVLIQLLG